MANTSINASTLLSRKDGLKEVLGMWMAETESAAFWMSVLTDLKAPGRPPDRLYR
jgi:transposase-like protein